MSEHLCEACGRGKMHRSERRGLWEIYVLPIMGLYPWRCNFCRTRIKLSDRGPKRQYVRSSRESKEHSEV